MFLCANHVALNPWRAWACVSHKNDTSTSPVANHWSNQVSANVEVHLSAVWQRKSVGRQGGTIKEETGRSTKQSTKHVQTRPARPVLSNHSSVHLVDTNAVQNKFGWGGCGGRSGGILRSHPQLQVFDFERPQLNLWIYLIVYANSSDQGK